MSVLDMKKPIHYDAKALIPSAILVLLLIYASIEINDHEITPGEYLVGVGTVVLALFTFIATTLNHRDVTADQKVRLIKSKLEELYGPILSEKAAFISGAFTYTQEKRDSILIKSYLGSKEIRDKINEFAKATDETWGASRMSRDARMLLDSASPMSDEKKLEAESLITREEDLRKKTLKLGNELVHLVEKESDRLIDEIHRITT